ncbi:hypothetical protein RRG08_008478 [Elysia crispata]|uniref:Uncharacterized protein n=1 Tax=Elysia crispata TaxID=231223 RepID=A0AAE0Z886_9GAST|nr:hypothetical protein RRG08_008478 [Elysia crispata]
MRTKNVEAWSSMPRAKTDMRREHDFYFLYKRVTWEVRGRPVISLGPDGLACRLLQSAKIICLVFKTHRFVWPGLGSTRNWWNWLCSGGLKIDFDPLFLQSLS